MEKARRDLPKAAIFVVCAPLVLEEKPALEIFAGGVLPCVLYSIVFQ